MHWGLCLSSLLCPNLSPATAKHPVCASGFLHLFKPSVRHRRLSEKDPDTSGLLEALLVPSRHSTHSLSALSEAPQSRVPRWAQTGPLPGAPADSNPSCQATALLKTGLISPFDPHRRCVISFSSLAWGLKKPWDSSLLQIARLFLDFSLFRVLSSFISLSPLFPPPFPSSLPHLCLPVSVSFSLCTDSLVNKAKFYTLLFVKDIFLPLPRKVITNSFVYMVCILHTSPNLKNIKSCGMLFR